jgi:predicted TIM-barrel fold metal-dependent hydrolase
MDEYGIGLAWLLTWEILPFEDRPEDHEALNPAHLRSDGTHAGLPLSDVLIARDRHPERFVAGFCPHPLADKAPERFEEAVRNHRVRVCGEWKCRMEVDDPRSIELFRKAGALKCPVVVHLDVPDLRGPDGRPVPQKHWYGGTVANLESALKACPGTVFIGHGPGFWREISGDGDGSGDVYPSGPVTPGGRLYALFDSHANLHGDLSAGSALTALSRDPAHARSFLARYAGRLLFGRDDLGGKTIEFLTGLGLPARELDAILGGNALRLVPWS